jgi:hypothetical protein
MDRLGDIRLFVEAAQHGAISAAGRKLGLTPAAASARLAKLEAALSTRFEQEERELETLLNLRSHRPVAKVRKARKAIIEG